MARKSYVWRPDETLYDEVKDAAESSGRSVNQFLSDAASMLVASTTNSVASASLVASRANYGSAFTSPAPIIVTTDAGLSDLIDKLGGKAQKGEENE